MGCNQNKIENFEARLQKIAKLKAALEKRLQSNKEVDNSTIAISNAQYENKVNIVEGTVRRAVAVQGDEIIPIKNNPNTIDNVLDELDSNSLNTPKVLPGDFVEVQFIENDYWANNKDKVEEAWMEAPLYLIDKDGTRTDLLEAYKENNINTYARKAMYEALQEGKKVELQVESKIPNFNNIRIGGMPVFFSVEEQLKMHTFRDIDGNFLTATPEESKPVLLVASGVGNELSPLKWALGDLSYLDPKIQEAIIGDLGEPKRLPKSEHRGQIFSLSLTPEGKYSYIKLSTRSLSNKAYEYVLNELKNNRGENIKHIVGNSTFKEFAHKDPKFLSIETVPIEEDKDLTFINFHSPKHDKAVRITSEEFNKGLNKEEFTFNIGKFIQTSYEGAAPNFKWQTSKTIKVSPSDNVNEVINEFLGVLKNKKHQINRELLASQENFSIPGFTKPSGYNTYQEYLFDEDAHGDPYSYNIPIKNNGAILNTDIKNINGSVYYNTRLNFNDVLIDGKSILTDPSFMPEGGLNPAIAPNLRGAPKVVSAGPNINKGPKIKPSDLEDLTAFSTTVGNKKSLPLDTERAKIWLEERFGKGSTTILQGVNKIGNITRHGYFENMAFYLYENSKIGTEFHEGFHGMFRMWFNDKQREDLYNESRKKWGIPTDREIKELNAIREKLGLERLSIKEAEELVLEEKMAEDFSEYMLTDGQSSPGGKIAKFFKSIWNFIKSIFTDSMSIRQAYEMLESNVVPVTFRRNIQRFSGDTANSIEGYTDKNIKEVLDYLTSRYRNTIKSYKNKGKKVPYKSLNNKIKNSVLREAFSTKEGLPIEGPQDLEVLKQWMESRFDGLLKDNGIVKSSPQPIIGEPKTQAYPAQNNHAYLINIYENWNDLVDNSETENLRRIGFESLMKDSLINYGLKLKLSEVILEEIEEGSAYERIYSRSRVEENMIDKTGSRVKEFLSTIPTQEASYLGYETFMDPDNLYKDLQNILVNSTSFPEMLYRLEESSKTKPHIAEVYKRLKEDSDNNLRAAFTFTFIQSKNNFFLGKETKEGLQFINSDRNSIQNRLLDQWRTNATEHAGFPNERHLYKIRQVENNLIYTPNKNRVKKLNSVFNSINKIYDANPTLPVPEKRIEDLINFLYMLGIDLSTSTQESKDLLTTYFNEGSTDFSQTGQLLKGVALYKAILDNGTSSELNRLMKGINQSENIYTKYTGILSRFSNITMKNDIDIFTSFINVKNNSIHPINMPTVMDDLILNLKSNNLDFFTPYLSDGFYNPLDYNKAARSIWLSIYGGFEGNFSKQAKANLETSIVDGYRKINGRAFDFGEMNELQSAYFRLTTFMDRSNKKGYVKLFVPNLSDRSKLKSYTVPSIDTIKKKLNLTEKDIIKGIIIQDLMRYQQAERDTQSVEEGGLPINQLIPGFHYLEKPGDGLGSAFQLMQLTVAENSEIFGTKIERYLSDVNWGDYLAGNVMAFNREAIDDVLNTETEKVIGAMKDTAAKNMQYYVEKGLMSKINKSMNNPYSNTRELFIQYELNNLIHKIELQKFTRGGIAFNKGYTDFSKRFGNMETPGFKLLLKGDLKDSEVGFYKTFNEGLMEDFFTSSLVYDSIGESITATLQQQGDPQAENIGNLYKGGKSNKSDAFGVVSIDFYKAFMEGQGQWEVEDEQAYQNYKNGKPGNKFFRDNSGRHRRVAPIKTYFDAMIEKNGIMIPSNTKNSYMVLLEEFTKTNPTTEMIRQRMEGESNFFGLPTMHVLNTISTKKLAYTGVEDLSNTEEVLEKLTNISLTSLPGSGLRIPQIVPEKSKSSGLFSRQFMINIISNMDLSSPNLDYIVNEGRENSMALNAEQVFDLYQRAIVTMIDKSYDKFITDVGYKALLNAKSHEDRINAQLQLFKNLRSKIQEEIQDKDLSNNYLNALELEKTEKGNYRFKTPLSFPFLKRKTEGLVMGMLKNDIVKQRINGGSAKQIGEIGGHITWNKATNLPNNWTELKFLRNENGSIKHAEIAIRADIARQYGLKPGDDLNQIPESLRTVIGYRIPNSGKNLMLPMSIKYVLPENYDQAIVVPGGITTQMGSDFDIDTLYIMKPNTRKNSTTGRQEKIQIKYTPNFTADSLFYNSNLGLDINYIALENLSRPELENIIIDLSEAILRSKKHFKEVVQPLDSPDLKNIAENIKETLNLGQELDPNDSFSEIRLERMNKDGNTGIGIYANSLTGKNITSYSQMYLNAGLSPTIDGVEYNDLQRIMDNKSESIENRESEFIEYIISKRLQSALDNAKAPDMFFRNDNLLTAPVNILFDSLGINEFTTHDYLNQPIIRMLTEVYQDGEYTPNMLYEAASETWDQYKSQYTVGQHLDIPFSELTDFGFSDMFTIKLQNITEENIIHEDQLGYLNNFLSFHKTGRDLSAAYTVISQDKGADQSTFGGLLSFKNRKDVLVQNNIIKGFNSILEGESYPLQRAYKNVIDKMLDFGSEFFIHNKRSVIKSKSEIQTLLNINNLTDKNHRQIEDAMLLYVMSNKNSPLSSIFTDEKINELLRRPKTNVLAKLQRLKLEFPRLKDNSFIKNIIEHPNNIKEGSLLTRIKFQNIFSFTKTEKDSFTRAFGDLMTDPESEIRQLAIDLIGVSVLSNGFIPGHDSFIDTIPVEALKKSANYFYEQFDLLDNREYFGKEFAHDFIRNFYYTDAVPTIRVSKSKIGAKTFTIKAKDSRIYSREFNKTLDYFTVAAKGGSKLFVKIAETFDNVTYSESTTKGVPFGLQEFNISDLEGSLLNKSVLQINYAGKSNIKPGLPLIHETRKSEAIQDEQDAVKRCINIR
tara:strand:+ start:7158 stop:15557 length:8400 start_codon:yes stop_codon:yes gene_type:complete